MTHRSLLDTDILSEVLKGVNANILKLAEAYRKEYGVFTTSVITVLEIVKGFQKAAREEKISEFLNGITSENVLSIRQKEAELAGRIYGELERRGVTIGRADPMVASVALQHDLVLVTGNIRHFERIRSLGYPLRMSNWRE